MSQSSDINIIINKLNDYQLGLCSLTELIDFIYQMNDNSNMNDDEIPVLDDLTELIQITNKVRNKELNITQLIKAARGYKKYLQKIDYKNNLSDISQGIDLSIDLNDQSHQILRNTATLAKNGNIDSEVYFTHLQQYYKAIIDQLKSSNMELDESNIISFSEMKEKYYKWVNGEIKDSEYFQLINTFLNPPAISNNEIVNNDNLLNVKIGDQIQLVPGAVDSTTKEVYRSNETFVEGNSSFLTIYDIKEVNGLFTLSAGVNGVEMVNTNVSNIAKVIYSPQNVAPQTESTVKIRENKLDTLNPENTLTNFMIVLKDNLSDNPTFSLTDLVNAYKRLLNRDNTPIYPYAPYNNANTDWGNGSRSVPYIRERTSDKINAIGVPIGSVSIPNGTVLTQTLYSNYEVRHIERSR